MDSILSFQPVTKRRLCEDLTARDIGSSFLSRKRLHLNRFNTGKAFQFKRKRYLGLFSTNHRIQPKEIHVYSINRPVVETKIVRVTPESFYDKIQDYGGQS